MRDPIPRPARDGHGYFLDLPTRWMDNDLYGHVNNVVYFSFIDTVVNRFLVDEGRLDIHHGRAVGLVVESRCSFYAPVSYPEVLTGGMRVTRLGRSSVTYEVALFRGDEQRAAATGRFVHVFVDRESMDSVPIPQSIREAPARMLAPNGGASAQCDR